MAGVLAVGPVTRLLIVAARSLQPTLARSGSPRFRDMRSNDGFLTRYRVKILLMYT